MQVGVHGGQRDQVRHVHGGEQGRHPATLVERGVERLAAAVQGGTGGRAGKGQVAPAQLVAQLLRVGGQVAERAELDCGVAGGSGLVEEPVPGHLLRVVGEPDAPRVRGGAEPQVGQARRASVGRRGCVDGHVTPPHRGQVGDVVGRPRRRAGAVRGDGWPPLSGQRVLLAAKPAILSMLDESTNEGPVSTGLPPPMSLPLVSCSHSESTAR